MVYFTFIIYIQKVYKNNKTWIDKPWTNITREQHDTTKK